MNPWKSLSTYSSTVHASHPKVEGLSVHEETAVDTTFTVYRDFFRDGRKFTGKASFEVPGSDLRFPPGQQLAEAEQRAELGSDPWYPVSLERPGSLPSKTSSLSKQALTDWIEPIRQTLLEAVAGNDFELQNEFIRLSRQELRYRDSSGHELDDIRYVGYLEVFLLPKGQPEAHPFHGELHFSEFSPALFSNFLKEQGRLTLGTSRAVPFARPRKEFPVVIRGQAVQQVFAYVMRQLRGPSLYSGASTLTRAQTLWGRESTGDLVTLNALVLLYDSPETALFDDQGTILKTQSLVKDGVVQNFLTNQEMAHWLGVPLTGLNRNLAVSPGTADLRQLAGQEVLEVHRLRTADIEESTGEFVAEVELADFHSGSHKTPVFGFALKGNLRDALSRAQFSREIGSWENFEGPEFLLVPSTCVLEAL